MCNSYRIQPKRVAKGLAQRVSEAAARLSSALVRKSDPGIVVRADGQVEVMRWGFQPFTGPLGFTPCESPLTKRPDNGPQQTELF